MNSCSPRKLKLFIVEDSPLILDNLTATLEELAPIVVVGSATDELAAKLWLLAPGNQWDLVIIDIFLKVGSGLGVLRAIAQPPWTPMDPRRGRHVVLTNYATDDMRERCLLLGADRIFDKSNEIDGLIEYCTTLARGNACAQAVNP